MPYSSRSFGKELSYHESWEVILGEYRTGKAIFENSSNKDVDYICPLYAMFLGYSQRPFSQDYIEMLFNRLVNY